MTMAASEPKQIRKAVIPAAGFGTRLLPATKSQPKEMLPVGRKPVIQYVVEEIAAADINQVLVVTSQQKRAIEDHFDINGSSSHGLEDVLRCQMHYTRQSVPKGLADAIAHAEGFVAGEPFVVSLGDSLIRSEAPGSILSRLVATHVAENAAATILFENVAPEDVVNYGIAQPAGEPGKQFAIADLVEKPSVENAPSTLAVAGRYVFSPVVFDYIRRTKPGRGGEIQITDTMRLMLQDGLPLWGVQMSGGEHRLDIGNYRSYFRAFLEMALMDPEFGPEFAEFARERLAEDA
jgi:UTP--glucose-1-phosphate uridylyltransferase